MAAGDGARCGAIILESASEPGGAASREAFLHDVTELVERTVARDDFHLPAFGNVVFELQRDHRVYAASDFAFPLMSLMVLEGTVRAIWPAADFRAVGAVA